MCACYLCTVCVILCCTHSVVMSFTFPAYLLFFQVVEQGMFVKHCKVEVYLTELKLCEDSNMDLMVTRRFSKADTIGRHESPRGHLFTQMLSLKWIQIGLSCAWLCFSILITMYYHCFSCIHLLFSVPTNKRFLLHRGSALCEEPPKPFDTILTRPKTI